MNPLPKLLLPCLLPFVLAAQAPPPTSLDGASPALARLLAAATASLRQEHAVAGRPAAMRVLGHLRLGDVAGSASVLAAATRALAASAGATPSAGDVAWLLAAHLWHARAVGTPATTPAQWVTLTAAAERAAAAPGSAWFLDEAMQVHGLFCCGALADARHRAVHPEAWRNGPPEPRPGAHWTALAIDRQIELERQTWQPGQGRFRAFATRGAIATPEPAAAATLLPASAGLLLATGDRMQRHLIGTLARLASSPSDEGSPAVDRTALHLVTATQLLADAARERAWSQLLAAGETPIEAGAAGFVLDAVLFAVTGVRLATGAGIDEAWQRSAPWLPPAHDRLAVRNLLAGGACYDVTVTARSGPPRDDEADPTAHLAGAAPRLHVQWHRLPGHDPSPRTFLVAAAGAQTMTWLLPGESFACSLPRTQPDAQHDLHAIGEGTDAGLGTGRE